MKGIVTSVHKTGYEVTVTGGAVHFCIVNNSYKHDERPVVGDKVTIKKELDKYLLIDREERKTVIGRFDHERNVFQTFAANVDVVFIVTSANKEFNPNRIQRFLKLIEGQDVKPVVVITKRDLTNKVDEYVRMAKEHDVTVTTINSTKKEDVMGLLNFVKRGQTMLLLGSSGVGKSTITNTITGLNIRTQETRSARHGNRGRHTTSARNLYFLKDNKKIIDSPGISVIGARD